MAVLRSALLALAVCETANGFVAPAARAACAASPRASPRGAEPARRAGDARRRPRRRRRGLRGPEASKSASALAPETLFFEGPPSITELVLPAISIITIIGVVPFLAAAARQVWVKYKITSRRISVQSGLGGNDFTEIIYSDIVDLKYVYRGSKEVGDMVIELRDGAKLEMRHVPKFQDIYKYIYSLCSEECQATAASMK
ncbi:hypothetical protein JL721_9349 [Aureococcus anophagefferens]|nr:hypothetical protein JL721_9349 [Aureococcus anophagefferens]